jgi:hypothetical protein
MKTEPQALVDAVEEWLASQPENAAPRPYRDEFMALSPAKRKERLELLCLICEALIARRRL